MTRHEDWLSTNILGRLADHSLDFRCQINPHEFKLEQFHDACDRTAEIIASAHSRRYLALSNGVDSEYVARCLKRNDVNFTPVIVIPEGLHEDFRISMDICDELALEPVMINVTMSDVFTRYYKDIVKPLNGVGINSVYTLFAADHARSNGGVLITGDHMLGDNSHSVQMIEGAEWDFYLDALHPMDPYVPFFSYRLETIYSMTYEMDGTNADDFRYRLYGVDFRPKFKYKYDERQQQVLHVIHKNRVVKPLPVHQLGDRTTFLRILERWRIK